MERERKRGGLSVMIVERSRGVLSILKVSALTEFSPISKSRNAPVNGTKSFNAVCVAVLIGLFASLVLSTFESPTSDFV